MAAELTAAVRRGQLPDQLPTDAAFTGDAATAALAYEQAWLACRLIAERAGQAGLLRVYRLVGGQATASSTATASALRAVLHESTAQFTAQWRTFLRQLLG
ncbi:MAG: hypothetical protein ACTHMS_08870 [Jatrophihabitans sp.]|uniref:hypothetical protein n=1 Tax=Jatrophihabitans sp. TaxID=1932789 RepID=UPI003F80587E